jgi:multimeric flavodoxin WrbA
MKHAAFLRLPAYRLAIKWILKYKGEAMKLLFLNGSHRGSRGFTSACIDKIMEGAASSGAECEKVDLSEKKINECTACGRCLEEDHYQRCIYHDRDDVAAIFDAMKSADIILYATPVYIMTISGLLKKFFDRFYSIGNPHKLKLTESGLLFHHTVREILAKPFAVLVCGDNSEDLTYSNIIQFFKLYSKFLEARQVGLLIRRSAYLFQQTPIDSGLEDEINDVYGALKKAGRELVAHGEISQKTQRHVDKNIIPMPPVFKLMKNFRFVKRMVIQFASQENER